MSEKNNALTDQFNKKKNAYTDEELAKIQSDREKAVGERNRAKRAEESTFWGGLKKSAKELYDYGARNY